MMSITTASKAMQSLSSLHVIENKDEIFKAQPDQLHCLNTVGLLQSAATPSILVCEGLHFLRIGRGIT